MGALLLAGQRRRLSPVPGTGTAREAGAACKVGGLKASSSFAQNAPLQK